MMSKPSPCVTHFSWGQIEIEGFDKAFKDAKIYPGGAREWNWKETGTRHEPGIQPSDVLELLDKGANVVVLSKGVNERLHVCPATLKLLNSNKVIFHVLQTEKAVTLYNQLCRNKSVGGLFHSTC